MHLPFCFSNGAQHSFCIFRTPLHHCVRLEYASDGHMAPHSGRRHTEGYFYGKVPCRDGHALHLDRLQDYISAYRKSPIHEARLRENDTLFC